MKMQRIRRVDATPPPVLTPPTAYRGQGCRISAASLSLDTTGEGLVGVDATRRATVARMSCAEPSPLSSVSPEVVGRPLVVAPEGRPDCSHGWSVAGGHAGKAKPVDSAGP